MSRCCPETVHCSVSAIVCYISRQKSPCCPMPVVLYRYPFTNIWHIVAYVELAFLSGLATFPLKLHDFVQMASGKRQFFSTQSGIIFGGPTLPCCRHPSSLKHKCIKNTYFRLPCGVSHVTPLRSQEGRALGIHLTYVGARALAVGVTMGDK